MEFKLEDCEFTSEKRFNDEYGQYSVCVGTHIPSGYSVESRNKQTYEKNKEIVVAWLKAHVSKNSR